MQRTWTDALKSLRVLLHMALQWGRSFLSLETKNSFSWKFTQETIFQLQWNIIRLIRIYYKAISKRQPKGLIRFVSLSFGAPWLS